MKQLTSLARHSGCVAGACMGTAFAASPVRAAETSATTFAALGVVAVAIATLVVAAAVVVIIVLWLARRARLARVEDEAGQLRQDIDRLRDVIRAAPMAHVALDRDSSKFVPSPELISLIGCQGEPGSIDDMAAVFRTDDAAALQHAYRQLVGSATEILMEVAKADGDRTFSVTSSIVQRNGDHPVLWFRETTSQHAALASITERCRAFEGDHERLLQILDTLPMPVWRRQSNLALDWVNRAHRVAVEAGADVPISDQNMELVPGIGAAEARALARRSVERNEPQAERRRFVVGGDRKSFELVEMPLATGEVVGFAHDITERDDAMGELARYSEANIEVFNRLQSAIAIFSVERRLTFFNDAFVRLWGFEEAWLESQPGHDEVLENLRQRRRLPEQVDFQGYKNAVLDHYTSLLEPHEEMEILPDGTTIRSVMSPHPLGGLMIIYEDVTDRLELERARNTTQAVQQTILDHLLEGLAVFGSDGRLKLFNAGFCRMWDVSEEFLASEPHVSEVVESCRALIFQGSDEAPEWVSLKDRIIENALEREPRTSRLQLTDGRTIRCSGVPLPDGAMLYTYVDTGQIWSDDDETKAGGMNGKSIRSLARGT